ncbi:lysylphosphatidylglycerol synthase transmembrane domain-containing protein [Cupriavidus respiraculi]|uniref:Flippase-like domain-containing protein n=1 Tax=Cupriavidus respiraculi TaxID=195930 RepID=A0ABM8XCI3_9BURK|nr:lysylphosphatidylglycerol synthase transmembrane domain-containing protein [Cupriavidus respiraculi]CAG9177796.1 hypothetical protein LMG21510_03397 [Cupriavidus respiraculi]
MAEKAVLPERRSLPMRLLGSPLLKIGIAVAVIWGLVAFNRIDVRVFVRLTENWQWLLLAFLLMLPPYVIVSYRFWTLLRNQHIDVGFGLAMRWTMIGSFFDIVMPSNSGGDVVKAGYIVKYLGPGMRTKGIVAVVFDRVLGLLGLFLLAGLACLGGWGIVRTLPNGDELVLFIGLICVGSLGFFRIMGARRLYGNARIRSALVALPGGQKIISMIGCFNLLREKPSDLFRVLALSVLNHVFWCAALLCICIAFGQDIGLLKGFAVFPIAIFSNTFGFAGGFGIGTAAFDLLFARLLDVNVGASIGLAFQILSVISRLSGLPFYLLSKPQSGD